ncbi:ADP-ribosylation factor-binding protein GGA3 isoform X2 [Perognathus longimembris pacificus]|uniref:ADP-ribosylation factor-binding protein GGA3 isoform X2 n=1 Tax=Perognathus longimembris pacificus TaxID=214514 RepID=UPI0020192FFD|nr:ADP-ribosylation factor-binding protein GGA3 isoform X2 [Perognathus longimembris pacificus]
MAEAEGESLESWLNKATNPSNRQEDWEYIIGFCDQINKELEGPQIAVRLLAHKIQSPQEWEALQALTVLEACMKNCGRRFHNEVGKFRFLNELIKVVSPKYLGDRVSEKVKTKVIELLYSWTVALPEEAKIKDAYHMLKRQGIVQSDPPIPMDRTLIPSPPPRPKNPVFDDEEKSKLLAKLLKSKNPDDLQEANKLIKSMVKEDEARIQKVTKRMHTLEEVSNNVKLLHEMLLHYSHEHSSPADKELMKELYDRCENKRRTLFKLASETEDNDNSLGDILQASDNLSRVINSYKAIVEGQMVNGDVTTSTLPDSEGNNPSGQGTLIDLAELDTPDNSSPALAPAPAPPSSGIPILPPPPQTAGPPRSRSSSQAEAPPGPHSTSNGLSLLDEELLCLGLTDPAPPAPPKDSAGSSQWHLFQGEQSELDFFRPRPGPAACCPSDGPLLPPSAPASSASQALPPAFPAPRASAGMPAPATGSFIFSSGLTPALPPKAEPAAPEPHSSGLGDTALSPLDGLGQLLEEAKVALPVTAYDKNGFRILFHFAKECPPGRPDVLVVVVSMLNTAPLPIKSIVLQAAVPKSMKVKLQPPSGTELSPFSPVQPPAAITQVMLLANPLKEKVRLRYRLTFALGEQLSTELGEVDQFPPVEQWGSL